MGAYGSLFFFVRMTAFFFCLSENAQLNTDIFNNVIYLCRTSGKGI